MFIPIWGLFDSNDSNPSITNYVAQIRDDADDAGPGP